MRSHRYVDRPRGTTGAFRVPGSPLPPPTGPRNLLDDYLAPRDEDDESHLVTCPSCGHVFDPRTGGRDALFCECRQGALHHELGHAALKIDCRGDHGTLKVTISAE